MWQRLGFHVCCVALTALWAPVATGAQQTEPPPPSCGTQQPGIVSLPAPAVVAGSATGLFDILHAATGPEAVQEGDEQEPRPWGITWDQGLRFVAPHGAFTMRTAFNVQNDSAAFVGDGELESKFGSLDGDVKWRRALVFADGTFARHFRYKFQYDFANSDPPDLKDSWVEFDLPLVPITIRGGRFRTPLTLEGYTSTMHTTFMERGLVATFVPSRNTGFLFSGEIGPQRHKMHWGLAWVRPEDPGQEGSPDASGITGRFTYKFNPREDVAAHAGFDYARLDLRGAEDVLRFSSRPESNLAPRLVDTGDFRVDATNTYVLEGAMVGGSLSVQSEFALVDARGAEFVEEPVFWAGYVFVSYFITGETRPYIAGREGFGRIRPLRDFRREGSGLGAFEVAARFSTIDLSSGDIDGGELRDFTAAFNWYPNRNARVMTNFIRADRSDFGTMYIFQVRLQWHY